MENSDLVSLHEALYRCEDHLTELKQKVFALEKEFEFISVAINESRRKNEKVR